MINKKSTLGAFGKYFATIIRKAIEATPNITVGICVDVMIP